MRNRVCLLGTLILLMAVRGMDIVVTSYRVFLLPACTWNWCRPFGNAVLKSQLLILGVQTSSDFQKNLCHLGFQRIADMLGPAFLLCTCWDYYGLWMSFTCFVFQTAKGWDRSVPKTPAVICGGEHESRWNRKKPPDYEPVPIWLVVTGTWLLFSHILGTIIPID